MKVTIKDLKKQYGKKAKALLEDKGKLNKLIEASVLKVDKLDKSDALEKLWQRLMLLFELIKAVVNGSYKHVPKATLVLIVIALIYFVNPFDLIPDVIPGIGHIDDLAVFGLVIGRINSDLEKFEDWKNNSIVQL